jgi:hypothetical protein
MLKRSGSTLYFGETNKKKSKVSDRKNKKNKGADEADEDYDEENPISFPNLFGKEDTTIYLDQNHLFFRTDISENSVDQVKKLMRQYLTKVFIRDSVSNDSSFVIINKYNLNKSSLLNFT